MAYAELGDNNYEKFEEVDALDCAGTWYQAFIISKDSRHILVHFAGSFFQGSRSMVIRNIHFFDATTQVGTNASGSPFH
jgi:hypothetical protein